jgi:hypothetical protein
MISYTDLGEKWGQVRATASRLAISILDRWPRRFEGLRTPEQIPAASRLKIRFLGSALRVRKLLQFSDILMPASTLSIAVAIRNRVTAARKASVWTPEDFADLGPRTAVDQALHRLVASGKLRRIARGLYDIPGVNRLTRKQTSPDPRAVIDALARKNNVRVLVDGITAANDLGLTNAVPARITVLTAARIRPVNLGELTIEFRHATPSRLYWAGRPAMRYVQALDWLRDMLTSDDGQLRPRLLSILRDPQHGKAIRDDLRTNLSALPDWMREIVRGLLHELG